VIPVLGHEEDRAVYRAGGIPGRYPARSGARVVVVEVEREGPSDPLDMLRELRADMVRAIMEGVI
jgi:hypothetical protein